MIELLHNLAHTPFLQRQFLDMLSQDTLAVIDIGAPLHQRHPHLLVLAKSLVVLHFLYLHLLHLLQ
jgi:hypothetical protein